MQKRTRPTLLSWAFTFALACAVGVVAGGASQELPGGARLFGDDSPLNALVQAANKPETQEIPDLDLSNPNAEIYSAEYAEYAANLRHALAAEVEGIGAGAGEGVGEGVGPAAGVGAGAVGANAAGPAAGESTAADKSPAAGAAESEEVPEGFLADATHNAIGANPNSNSAGSNATNNSNSNGANIFDALDRPTASTQDAPAFEGGTLLATLAQGVTLDQARKTVAESATFAGTTLAKEVAGLVRFNLPPSLTVENALDALPALGITAFAQPNFYYYPVDEETGELITDGIISEELITPAPEAPEPKAVDPEQQTDELDGAAEKFAQANTPATNAAPTVVSPTLAPAAVPRPNDFWYSEQWALPATRVPQAWEYVFANRTIPVNSPIIVAVLDNGFDTSHPDLQNNIVQPFNAVTMGSNVSTGKIDHGTHVAGIVAAEAHNGIGVAGSTYNMAKVMPMKVADDQGKLSTSYIIRAFNKIIEMRQKGAQIRVANMSLGGKITNNNLESLDAFMYQSIAYAREAQVLTVVAACNATSETGAAPFFSTPSDMDNVVSVINMQEGSSGADPVSRAATSNYNKPTQLSKNISAPGNIIISTWSGGGYEKAKGTSMASPLVAGIAALMFTVDPMLTPEEAASKLYSSAYDLHPYANAEDPNRNEGWDDETGFGLVNAYAAVSKATPFIEGPTALFGSRHGQYSVHKYISGEQHTEQANYTWSIAKQIPANIATITPNTGELTPMGTGEVNIKATNGAETVYQTVRIYSPSETIPPPVIEGPSIITRGDNAIYNIEPWDGKRWEWVLQNGEGATLSVNGSGSGCTVVTSGADRITSDTYAYLLAKAPLGSQYAGKVLKWSFTIKAAPKSKPSTNPTPTPAPSTEAMYRLYNRWTGEHFFTSDAGEVANLRSVGWTYEGEAWKAPKISGGIIYRLYNRWTGEHHYTLDVAEKNACVSQGWTYEGEGWRSGGSKAIYRLYNPYAKAYYHHYTADIDEANKLIRLGWKYEGIGWYGF